MKMDSEFKEDNLRKRSDSDLDSICVGSPSKRQIKLYCDSKKDSNEDILTRMDMLISVAKYAERKMEE
jgi:hypothetical protein